MPRNVPYSSVTTPLTLTPSYPSPVCIWQKIKDLIPILPGCYKPHPTWSGTLAAREEALSNRHMKAAKQWTGILRDSHFWQLATRCGSRIRPVHTPASKIRQQLSSRCANLINTLYLLTSPAGSPFETANS